MALYAFDGTWNEDEADPTHETNVREFMAAYGAKREYLAGVGTRFGAIGRMLGGLFGAGGRTRIEEMYDKLVENWTAQDHDIDIIGFSRGAALALHFANVVSHVGIEVDGQVVARPRVRFLGLWDVVASFGIPIDIVLNFQDINIGWELAVSDNVDHCVHAMALNERRQTFAVTRLNADRTLQNVEERWYRGVHSDVGGGNGNQALSFISLRWMLEQAASRGLPIDPAAITALHGVIDASAPVSEDLDPIENPAREVLAGDVIDPSALGRVLDVGDSARFTVRAPEQFSWSGVRVVTGGHYSFSIAPGQEWIDQDIRCGPEGWRTEDLPWLKEQLVERFESRRRCPEANWFELVGSVGEEGDRFFRIGKGGDDATYEAPVDGELFAFANDLRTMYGNNHGEIEVEVRRVAERGATRLEAC